MLTRAAAASLVQTQSERESFVIAKELVIVELLMKLYFDYIRNETPSSVQSVDGSYALEWESISSHEIGGGSPYLSKPQ